MFTSKVSPPFTLEPIVHIRTLHNQQNPQDFLASTILVFQAQEQKYFFEVLKMNGGGTEKHGKNKV